jgi:serine/threonine protein kinase
MINQARDPLVRQTIVQNFEREANILVTLSHPSIPNIYDYFTHNERSYLVLEYINGKDLEEMLSETQNFFPEEQVIQWAIELCDVLSYLHNHKPEPIIFRDMKPSNVMVNQFNHIILIDFGIAKNFRGGQKGTMIGTEGYSPPEQYRGEASPQADIYALGATLHHLLTRKDPRLEPPFTFADRPIRKINPAVTPEMEAVVSTALQYSPSDRFQSAQAMKEALIMAGKKTGLLARMPTSPAASSMAANAENPKPVWTFMCEDEIRGTPLVDQGVVYVGAYDNNLYVLSAPNGQFLWKYATEGGIVTRPAITEGLVLFGSEDKSLYAVSTRTGRMSWTFSTDGPIRSSPCVAEGHVFFGSDDAYLYALNLAGRSAAPLWSPGRSSISAPISATSLP